MPDSKPVFLNSSTVLPVDDVLKTAEFYRDKLGFEIAFLDDDPPNYAIVTRGDGVGIHFSQREDTSTKIHPCNIYIFVEGIDAVYAEYEAKGIEIFAPPADHDHGMREFELRDIDGHFLTFGQEI